MGILLLDPMIRSRQLDIRVWLVYAVCAIGLISTTARAWSGTDPEFIEMVASNNWLFFRNNQGGPYHLFRGSGHYNQTFSSDALATCAADGFGLAALCVGAWRGWMPEEQAYINVLALLRSYDAVLQRDAYGFFNHYNTFDSGLPQAEYSPIDSTWFICGALLAARYFHGTEVETVANRIYAAMNYRDGVNPYWSGYCEFIIMNIVGAGSPTYGWPAATSKDAWEVCARQAPAFGYGPLFWYQWPQVFVDFRWRVDGIGSNHFQNGVVFTLRQRQQCINLHNASPTNYPDFGTNGWGLTSATASKGYLELRPFGGFCTENTNYGYAGGCTNYIATDEDACDSGTLVPICLPASMMHAPDETRAAMRFIYDTYDPAFDVYGIYSFINAFNTGAAKSGAQHYSPINATMDFGCNVLALENFRSGMPWKYFMAHPAIATGMAHCGFNAPNIAYHDDWNRGGDPNVWTGGTTYVSGGGAGPTATYASIAYYNEWVNGYARRLAANASGDVVRFELKETDQSKQDLLSFWLRGETGGEDFQVGLRDAEGHAAFFPVTNYLGGPAPTNWTRVRIPLQDFAVSGNPNHDVRILMLGAFEVRFHAAGVIYLDDLAFVADDLVPAPPACGAACVDGRVWLRWGYSPDRDVVGYHLWRRPDAGSGFERINSNLLSAVHGAVDIGVESQWGEDFFYTVQAVDRHGNAGAFAASNYEQRVWIGRRRDVDWGDGANPNTFGGDHGRWGGSWGDVRFAPETGWDGRAKWVRRVEGDTDNGVWIGLGGSNVAAYEAVCFWLKQNWGAAEFDIGLKSTNGLEVKVPITRYAGVTTNWTYVVIPLIDFRAVDFTRMENLSFTFRAPGSVFMDELRFVRLERDASVMLVREAEQAGGHIGGDTNDGKWSASQGCVLGNGWGGNAGDEAWWVFSPGAELNEAALDLRYACGASTGRILEAWIDERLMGEFQVDATGGWGEEAGHLNEVTLRLGRITNATFSLKLRAPNAGSAVNLDRLVLRTGGRWFREAEHYDVQAGAGGRDYKPGASGGQVLGAAWGGTDGAYAEYSGIALEQPLSNALLRLRYGQNGGSGRILRVRLDGTNMGRVACARTAGWLDNWREGALAELPLGTVPVGAHTLRIEAEGAGAAVNLDWVRLDDAAAPFKEYDTDADRLPDSQEALFGTATNSADTDADGLADIEEISRLGGGYLTDPTNPDTDADRQNDGEEVLAGTDPTNGASRFEFIQAAARIGADGGVWLDWRGSAAAHYDVQYSGGVGNHERFLSVTDPHRISVSNETVRYCDDGTGTTPAPTNPAVRQRAYRIRAYRP